MTATRLGLIGFGEAGQEITRTMGDAHQLCLAAYDKLYQTDRDCQTAGEGRSVQLFASAAGLAAHADVILSVVTADEAVDAAKAFAPHIGPGHVFVDGNSVSPGTKADAAKQIQKTGATYVDMAIMAPIKPRGHQTPVLLAGPDQDRITALFTRYGFAFDWEGEKIGQASMVKMIRSNLIKGVESLICESVTVAEQYGLDERILASAGNTLGIENMPALADYLMERVAVHGRRRAAELREVAKTFAEVGLSCHMSAATARHQEMIADMALSDQFNGAVPQNRKPLAAAMRSAQAPDQQGS